MRDWAENQVMLALIRHGATPANREQRYVGRTDEGLSEDGREVLLSYKAQHLYPKVDWLFTSPMKRCMETAKLLYPELTPTVIPEWREIDFGRFEGKNYVDLKEDRAYQAWIDSGGTLDFPEGEGRTGFILRCEDGLIKMYEALCRAAEQNPDKPIRAGLIVHGGTIMALLSAPDGERYFDYQVSNGRGYLCRLEAESNDDVQRRQNMRIKVMAKL